MPLKYPLSSFRRSSSTALAMQRRKLQRGGRMLLNSGHVLAFFVLGASLVALFIMWMSDAEQMQKHHAGVRPEMGEAVAAKQERRGGASDRRGQVARMAQNVNSLVEPPPSHGASVGLAKVQKAKEEQRHLVQVPNDSKIFRDPQARLRFFQDRCAEDYPEADMTTCSFDNEMLFRQNRVSSVCFSPPSRFGSGNRHRSGGFSPTVDTERLLVMPYRQLVWCPVYKAASTNWMKNLPLLSNFRPSELQALKEALNQPNEIARHIAKPLRREAFLNYWRQKQNKPVAFMIVRHPFDRLLSAYRDKFEKRNDYFHSLYGRKMVRDFRKAGLRRFGVDFYLNHEDQSAPTFWEFVQAILQQNVVDDHWRPIASSCSVCNRQNVTYDYILRYENLEAEEKYMIDSLHLGGALRARHENANARPIDPEVRRRYFHLLDEAEVGALFDFYRADFELFEYGLDGYRH